MSRKLCLLACAVVRAQIFDVTGFGAVGDGRRNDTAAVRRAADALARAGGGTLLFVQPPHKINQNQVHRVGSLPTIVPI